MARRAPVIAILIGISLATRRIGRLWTTPLYTRQAQQRLLLASRHSKDARARRVSMLAAISFFSTITYYRLMIRHDEDTTISIFTPSDRLTGLKRRRTRYLSPEAKGLHDAVTPSRARGDAIRSMPPTRNTYFTALFFESRFAFITTATTPAFSAGNGFYWPETPSIPRHAE